MPWLWRISRRDDLLAERIGTCSTLSDFAATDAQRDWFLKQLAGFGLNVERDFTVERVRGPLDRAIAEDRARRRRLVDARWANRQAELAGQARR